MPQSEQADTKPTDQTVQTESTDQLNLDFGGSTPTVQEYQTLNGDRQREAKLMSPGFDVV